MSPSGTQERPLPHGVFVSDSCEAISSPPDSPEGRSCLVSQPHHNCVLTKHLGFLNLSKPLGTDLTKNSFPVSQEQWPTRRPERSHTLLTLAAFYFLHRHKLESGDKKLRTNSAAFVTGERRTRLGCLRVGAGLCRGHHFIVTRASEPSQAQPCNVGHLPAQHPPAHSPQARTKPL